MKLYLGLDIFLLKIYVPVLTQIITKMDWTYRVITKITTKSCNVAKMQHLPFIFKRNPPPLPRSTAPAIAVACYGDKSISLFCFFYTPYKKLLKVETEIETNFLAAALPSCNCQTISPCNWTPTQTQQTTPLKLTQWASSF